MNRADLMLSGAEALIPLRNRHGEVVDHALVDADNIDDLSPLNWYRTAWGYAAGSYGRRSYFMHRVILDLSFGDPRQGDHIDGDRLDNRRENLRIVTLAENRQNTSSVGKTSRYRGVSYWAAQGKWRAQARSGGRCYDEFFDREEDAALAVSIWRQFNMPYANEERH